MQAGRKALLVGAWVVACSASAQIGVHQHGVGQAQLSLDGRELRISLQIPAADLLGFEHAATTDEQRAQVAALPATWGQTGRWVTLDAAAQCVKLSVNVLLGDALLPDARSSKTHAHDPSHAPHDDDHQDAQIELVYQCESPEQLIQVELNPFALLPGLQTLQYQSVWPTGQGAGRLQPGMSTVPLRAD